jgi:GNAT superfamily N-acetyltransferase
MSITLRPGTLADTDPCGRICYDAFTTISTKHSFPPDFPSADVATGFLRWILQHPRFYVVVAERDRQIIGSNCLDERDAIAGVGPITVDPAVQNAAVGRRLMQAVLDRAEKQKAVGVRLVQAAFHNRSLSLYTKLGFDVREPLACMQGPPMQRTIAGFAVRAAVLADLDACNRLSRDVHGLERGNELRDMIEQGMATVVERGGRITGYASTVGFFGHAVAETNDDLKALIAAAPAFPGPGFLLPSRNSDLFRWCLENGLRVTQPMTLMSLGLYHPPTAPFLPSITY